MAINTLFQNIADAIREKAGTSGLITPAQMPQAIADIPGGGYKNILTGTSAPTSSDGENGDIYLLYFDVGTSYDLLNSIQFVDGAYIDTNLIPSNHCTELSVNDLVYVNDKHWLGTASGSLYYHFTTWSNKYYWGKNGSEGNGGTYATGNHLLEYNKGSAHSIIIDGTTIGSGSDISSTTNLLIGKRDTSANANNFKVNYCKITNNQTGNVERYMVPVKRISDSAIGMYDAANDIFYGNAGTNSFIAGTVVNDEYIIDTFCKVGGTWQNLIGTYIGDVNIGDVNTSH